MMSSWRRSRLVWSFCFLEYLLCHVSDSLNLESFEGKKREALQELKFSFRGSSKQPEKYIYRDRQPSLDSKSETCTHCEGLEKFNRGVDSSYLNLRGDSKDENIIHDEKNVKSQLSQWESIQFSFSYLEEELKYWRIFSQNLPKNFVKERVALEPLFYDFDKIYVLNSCMKKEIKKRSHMASAGELFATSIHGIPEIENAIYEKILTDLIEFIFEKKTELDKGVYYPLKTNYLAGLFNFLNHWKLIPPNLLETFQLKISSQFGIKWISQRILEGLNLKATISVNFPANFILFHVKGYFENHFFLGYIDRFLNYLKIPEINLVWLYVMKKTLIIKLNKFPHASRVNPYHQISHIQRLVLSIFENTEIQLLKQTTIKSDDMNALDIPIKFREDISKLKSFISNPDFEYNESLMGSYENTYEILIGSALFMNYLYENFYKNSSRDDITFSPVFLSTLKVLKAKVTVDLWTSTLVHLYSFFYVHHKHLLGVKENDFEERKILYLRRMEDYRKENFEKLKNELKNDSKNKKLFKENIYYRLRSPVYMGKGPLQELEELPQNFLDFAN